MFIIGIVLIIILAPLILAPFTRKEYHIEREITINAPRQKVFDYIKLLRNQDNFNKWVMVEPNMEKNFTGVDGTVGFIYAWKGKKAGEGEQEIKKITEPERIETVIRFVRPFVSIAHANITLESISDTETKVIWSNSSAMKYPLNIMISVIEKMLGKDMDTSLDNLKKILEK